MAPEAERQMTGTGRSRRSAAPLRQNAGLASGPPRANRTSTSSSVERKRERSALLKGGGPPPAPLNSVSPPARRSALIARVAIAPPIELRVKARPFGASTDPPSLRQRSASRISAVITTQPGAQFSTIQSSAASKASLTSLRPISALSGTRIGLLLTMVTGTRWRSATL